MYTGIWCLSMQRYIINVYVTFHRYSEWTSEWMLHLEHKCQIIVNLFVWQSLKIFFYQQQNHRNWKFTVNKKGGMSNSFFTQTVIMPSTISTKYIWRSLLLALLSNTSTIDIPVTMSFNIHVQNGVLALLQNSKLRNQT